MRSNFFFCKSILLIFIFLTLYCGQSDNKTTKIVNEYRLVERNGLIYEVNENDPFSGKVVDYYDNGQKKVEKTYVNGLLNGQLLEWYKNGQKCKEINYLNNKRSGQLLEWYENGQKLREINYLNNKKSGLLSEWDSSGRLLKEANFENGKLVGKYKVYFNKDSIDMVNEKLDRLISDLQNLGARAQMFYAKSKYMHGKEGSFASMTIDSLTPKKENDNGKYEIIELTDKYTIIKATGYWDYDSDGQKMSAIIKVYADSVSTNILSK